MPNNFLINGIKGLIRETLDKGEFPLDNRVKSLEQVLFKTSQADRNRLFDHIYERINNSEKHLLIEIDKLEKQLRRNEKRAEIINLQHETQREQSLLTQSMCRSISQDLITNQQKNKEWYDDFMVKV